MNLVHVVNVEIKDNHEEATLGSFIIYDLVEKVCTLLQYTFQVLLTDQYLLHMWRNLPNYNTEHCMLTIWAET